MLGFIITFILLVGLTVYWHRLQKAHNERIEQVPIRIHVNGIRGKSTVTRLIAGIMREAGYSTVAKTTGSAARIIDEDGNETPIARQGAPTILEQIDVIAQYVTEDTDALVIECMAVNPLYQHVSQHQIVKGNITIITNVREDHQDVMGHTLPEIAESLSNTIPDKGIVITAEERPEIRQILAENAAARGSGFIYANPVEVSDRALQGFDYLSFKENLALGFAVADTLNIPRSIALRGMRYAMPDIGAVKVQHKKINGKEIIWAPLFAVNDRESTIISVEALRAYHSPQATRIGILNNRLDRAVRAIKFAEIAALDLKLDYYILVGSYVDQVTEKMVSLGYPKERIIKWNDTDAQDESQMLQQITNPIAGEQGVLIGLVNIHTPQAEWLLEYFTHRSEKTDVENVLLTESKHISLIAQRQRLLLSRLLPNIGTPSS